jgi:hypothetical protein
MSQKAKRITPQARKVVWEYSSEFVELKVLTAVVMMIYQLLSRWFLVRFFFNPEDEGDMVVRNVCRHSKGLHDVIFQKLFPQ